MTEWNATISLSLKYSRQDIDLILVWGDPDDDPRTAARNKISNHVRGKGKFGLSELKRYLYKGVRVMSKAEFQREFIEYFSTI